MSKYTADEVRQQAARVELKGMTLAADMLGELYFRLSQEEEENRRDPVMEPRPGDRIVYNDNRASQIYVGNAWLLDDTHWTKGRKEALKRGGTIIRRREVQS